MHLSKWALYILVLTSIIACKTPPPKDVATEAAQTNEPDLRRFGHVPLGAEVTGLFVTDAGDFFFNVQHPSDGNKPPFDQATVGVVTGFNIHEMPRDFTPLALPKGAKKQTAQVAMGEYRILGRQGETMTGLSHPLGSIADHTNETVVMDSDMPDFNAFLRGPDENTGYLYTNWESIPGGLSRMTLNKDEQGEWMVTETMMVDFSGPMGTFANCFGSRTPWQTPLSSEEFFLADTRVWSNPRLAEGPEMKNLASHIGRFPNPYRYGYIVEITEPLSEKPVPVKHYAMGRFSHENAVVMPDRKTAYMSDDDGDAGGFWKFVADNPDDLSAGTLYAARVTQDRDASGELIKDVNKAGFDIEWVELASGNQAQIEAWIAAYDGITAADVKPDANPYLPPEEVEKWARGEAADDRALFLETRRAAGLKGASIEFTKLEGIQINFDGAADGSVPYMYLAMSTIKSSMSDDKGDIQLNEHRCGVVYQLKLDDQFNAARMEPAVVGGVFDRRNPAGPCPNEAIANPDNIQVLSDGSVIIGEDGAHENDMIWIYTPGK